MAQHGRVRNLLDTRYDGCLRPWLPVILTTQLIEYQIFTFGISLGLFFYVYHNTLLLTSADQLASRKKVEGGA